MKKISFNTPHLTGEELNNIYDAYSRGQLAGGGKYTLKCQEWLEDKLKSKKVLLTHSCTAALEMAALLSGVGPGDEVIMPSFTFVSTANAFVLRGAIPVFVDINPFTLNMDENLIEKALTKKTKAIVPVHYAGVACNMDKINEIAKNNSLLVIEDAAQGLMSKYNDKYLGSTAAMGAISFHETKNVISGEGGALLINDDKFIERAEIIWEKGTNRRKFCRGQVDKYTWVDIGSSFLPSEIIAAFLFAQLEKAESITKKRKKIWSNYHSLLEDLEKSGFIERPKIANPESFNAHIYYILLKDLSVRGDMINYLNSNGIMSVFHYVPLHSSPAGKKFGRVGSSMQVTDNISDRLLRLPLFYDLKSKDVTNISNLIHKFFYEIKK